MRTRIVVNKPEELLSELVGQYCWGVSWDSQLNLSMQFGEPLLHVHQHKPAKRYAEPKGRWWLWVYLAHWRVSFPDGRAITGTSPDAKRALGLFRLEGQALINAQVDGATARTRLGFDLGGLLEIRRISARDPEELWLLYRPRQYILTARGDGMYSHGPGTKDQHWLPIDRA